MSWNYRVVKRTDKAGFDYYGIHEVYYNKRGEICLISEDAIAPSGEDFDELRADVNNMQGAFGKPVLVYERIEFASMDKDGDSIENGVDWNATCYPPVGSPEFSEESYRN
jgi:hypothetical protein